MQEDVIIFNNLNFWKKKTKQKQTKKHPQNPEKTQQQQNRRGFCP